MRDYQTGNMLHQNCTKHLVNQVNVTIFMALNSIQDYDEVSGTLRLVVSYVMNWSDEIRIWDPVNHGKNILQTVFKIYGIIEDSRIAHITYA
jgi:hypothetical protein